MEHAQRVILNCLSVGEDAVLILILMEHAQRASHTPTMSSQSSKSLNPYFNGTCSKRFKALDTNLTIVIVLILILMEHAQRA